MNNHSQDNRGVTSVGELWAYAPNEFWIPPLRWKGVINVKRILDTSFKVEGGNKCKTNPGHAAALTYNHTLV